MTAVDQQRHPYFFCGVFLTCMCGLMLQIMETRILSVIGYYYLAFFAIGVAMLGMTAGALAVFFRAQLTYTPARLFELMSKLMAGFGWSVLVSLVVLLSITLGSRAQPTLTYVANWVVAFVVLLPPYVLLGAVVSLALTRSSQRINLVYGVDLVGAAGGCLATLLLLSITDTYTAILLVGAIGAFASVAFRFAMRSADLAPPKAAPKSAVRPVFQPALVVVVLLLAAGANQLLGTHGLRPVVVKNTIEPAQDLTEERWNSFSRIALKMKPTSEAFMWSPSAIAPRPLLEQGWLSIDGEAGTPIYRFGGNPKEVEFLRYDATALAYYIRNQGRSAVIGVGGGRDLLTSSISGFRDITGVEYNPIFVKLFSQDYRTLSGADKIPGLRLFTDDARSWFARSTERFDLIQMSLIDTWAATGAGAFTLSENGLYTVNGWKRFIARLTPTGVFTVSRWYAPDRLDETARILSLATATLIEMGEPDPASHIYLAANGNLSTLIVGRAPLTQAEVRTLDETVRTLQYRTLAAPGRAAADPTFERILRAKTTDELVRFGASTPINLTPTWDSNPFFFNQMRLSDPVSMVRAYKSSGVLHGNLMASFTLLILLLISAVVVFLVILAPARQSAADANPRTLFWSSAYFLTIGVGFMFVEISLIQRMSLFLGHPTYGLAIVLFSVILTTGAGSFISERVMPSTPRALAGWPLALAAYLATLPLWVGGVLDATETGSLLVRAAVCVGVILPGGVLMGFMFPTGMRLCSALDIRITPWLWAINGAAGVLASSAALLVSIETSLNHALWVGAIAYTALAAIALNLLKLSNKEEAQVLAVKAPEASAP
jgi:hypothetical protein